MAVLGRPINFLLGQGDESKPNLLGGTFGDGGDVVLFPWGRGGRFVLGRREKILQGAQAAQAAGGSWWGGRLPPPEKSPWGGNRDWRDRYRRER